MIQARAIPRYMSKRSIDPSFFVPFVTLGHLKEEKDSPYQRHHAVRGRFGNLFSVWRRGSTDERIPFWHRIKTDHALRKDQFLNKKYLWILCLQKNRHPTPYFHSYSTDFPCLVFPFILGFPCLVFPCMTKNYTKSVCFYLFISAGLWHTNILPRVSSVWIFMNHNTS